MSSGKVEVSLKLEDIPMIIDTIEELQQENKQLKDNWDKLKEYIDNKCEYLGDTIQYDELMIKMEQLEKGE